MQKLFNFLRINRHPKFYTIALLLVAIVLSTLELIFQSIHEMFLFENLFAYLFDVGVISFIIAAAIHDDLKLLEIAVVVLKTFEGTFYPLRSCQRLDALIASSKTDAYYIVNHVFFAVSAFMMLVALVFYCVFKVKEKRVYWDAMKLQILIAALSMFVAFILYGINLAINKPSWEEILEPAGLTVMFLGVYATCEYIDGEEVPNEQ